ncbi:hypothetical protein BSKO_08326 [Bryopsis sp. KO-2023]|nr:hypothetical protein BSKO_08326 [Bryopsis sp. KO-2023]
MAQGAVVLSPEKREHFKEAFAQVDTDGSGEIDIEELHAFLGNRWGETLPAPVIQNFIGIVDHNRDGKLQFDEFVELQMRFLPQCRGFCHSCNDLLINEEPTVLDEGDREMVLCFWCAEKISPKKTLPEDGVKLLPALDDRGLIGLSGLLGALSNQSSGMWDMILGRIMGPGGDTEVKGAE